MAQPLDWRGGIAKGYKPLTPLAKKLPAGVNRELWEELIRMNLQEHRDVQAAIQRLGDVYNSVKDNPLPVSKRWVEVVGA